MLFVIMFTQFGIIKSSALNNIINMPNELSNIDFSKPLNPNEEKRVTEYYKRKFEKKFTDEWVRKQLVQGKKMHVKEFGCSANKMRINGKKGKRRQIGKPYNLVIFNKGTTRKFYCSQLVWRAWLEQGFNLDWFDYGRYEPVYPFELYLSKKTVQYYVN